jgi:hypothetical protein
MSAIACCGEAITLSMRCSHVIDEFSAARKYVLRVARAGPVDATLAAWFSGVNALPFSISMTRRASSRA